MNITVSKKGINIFNSVGVGSRIENSVSLYLLSANELMKNIHNRKKQANQGDYERLEHLLKKNQMGLFLEVVYRITNVVLWVFGRNAFLQYALDINSLSKNILLKHREITHLKTTESIKELDIEKMISNPFISPAIKESAIELQSFQNKVYLDCLKKFRANLVRESVPQDRKERSFHNLPTILKKQLSSMADKIGMPESQLHKNLHVLQRSSNGEQSILDVLYNSYLESSKRHDEYKERLQSYKSNEIRKNGFYDPTGDTSIYDVSTDRLKTRRTQEIVRKPVSVVLLGVEYAGLIKEGGLAEAFQGLAAGLKEYNPENEVTVIFPKVRILPEAILKELKNPKTIHYSESYEYKVYEYKLNGINIHFIESDEVDVPEGYHSIYGPNTESQNKRLAAFNAFSADYIMKMNKKPDVVHLHDWHVAGTGLKLKKDLEESSTSENPRPAIVFTYHNNAKYAQGEIDGHANSQYNGFDKWDISDSVNPNLFISMIKEADIVNTVSETFAKESQSTDLGEGVAFAVRSAAKAGKLFGILNGNIPDRWYAKMDQNLINWKDPETSESVNLSYGADDGDVYSTRQLAKEQLQKWVGRHSEIIKGKVKIDSTKPLITYIGRYDSHQKGIARLEQAIEATLKDGGQFISMGTAEDPQATWILDKLERKYSNNPNVWIIRDYKGSNRKLFYQQGDENRQGIGSVIRACTDYIFMPSNFEPCGLTYREGFGFGSLAICSNTGGPIDVITSPEQDAEGYNGYLFKKEGDQMSSLPSCKDSIHQAISFWKGLSDSQKSTMMKRLVGASQNDSWVKSPKGMSPVGKYLMLYQEAKKRASRVNQVRDQNIEVVGRTATPLRDYTQRLKESYLASYHEAEKFGFSSEDLEVLYNTLPSRIQKEVPLPYGVNVQTSLYKEFGAHYKPDKTSFSYLASSDKVHYVTLVLYDEHENVCGEYPLVKDSEKKWTTTLPKIQIGQKYRFKVNDKVFIDPYAKSLVPSSKPNKYDQFSVVVDDKFKWTDKQWINTREKFSFEKSPVSIYECHLSTWKKDNKKPVNYRQLAPELVKHIKKFGFTHVELMGLLDHPDERSWGYQVTGFFAPNSRLGSLEDFKYLVNYLHKNKIGVILDFVPNHFAVDDYGLTQFQENCKSSPKPVLAGVSNLFRKIFFKYGSNLFDYRKKDVRETLISSAHYWLKEMHIDGLRVDCVRGILSADNSHMFLKDLNMSIKKQCRGAVVFAEDFSGASNVTDKFHKNQGLGFDSKWNVGWNHFTLGYFGKRLRDRKSNYKMIEEALSQPEQNKSILFLSHDELSSNGSFDLFRKWAPKLDKKTVQNDWKNLLTFLMTSKGKKLMFSGLEFGNSQFWDTFIGTEKDMMSEYSKASAFKVELEKMMSELSHLYRTEDALHADVSDETEWVKDSQKIVHAHRRRSKNDSLLVVHNFTNEDQKEFIVTLPKSQDKKYDVKTVFATNGHKHDVKWVRNYKDRVEYKVSIPKQTSMIIKERAL